MNLLIYSHAFAPQIGGIETYAMHLARGVAMRDGGKATRVTVVTQSLRKDFDDSALPFEIFRHPGMAQLRKLIHESDVVNLAGPAIFPLALALLARKSVVVEHHGYQASCPNGLLFYQPTKSACPNHYMRNEFSACLRCNASESGWFASMKMLVLMPLRRGLCRRASVNLCVANHVADRIDLPRTQVVYHGVPESLASTIAPVPKDLPLLSVGFLGRLVEEKGVPTLINAMHLLRAEKDRVSLTIIGDGPQRPQLEAMAREQNDFQRNISFTGSLQGETLGAALANIDVLVMPSNRIPSVSTFRGSGPRLNSAARLILSGVGANREASTPLQLPAPNTTALSRSTRPLARAFSRTLWLTHTTRWAKRHARRSANIKNLRLSPVVVSNRKPCRV